MDHMSASPIRTAVLGYGLAGRVFHCPFVSAVPGLQLDAIVTANPDRAAAASARYPSARILASADEAFADPAIELIVVGTPNGTHYDLSRRALEAHKHVVVDKPFSATSAEARALITLAAQQDKIVAPFHNRRFDNDFLTVRQLLTEKTLGRVATINSRMDRFRPLQRPNSWKESGGLINGLLFDLGPHLCDMAIALFGAPTRIKASVRSDRDQSDIDDAFDIILEYDSSSQSPTHPLRYECHATMLAAEPAARFQVHGTYGSYTKFGLDPQESTLIKGAIPPPLDSPDPWLPEPEANWGTLTLATQRTEPVQLSRSPYPSLTGDYRQFYVTVRDAIRTGSPLAIPAEDAFRVIRLLELAVQSSKERRSIPIDFA
jgi:scyllo-inositol 2-dehydrogenase (NADP+)